jgi:hypothetical protein
MQAFIVESVNQPGELARHAEAIAKQGLNIECISLAFGNRGATAFLSHDEKTLGTILKGAGFTYREVPLLTIWLDNTPGQVAWAARQLADAGVNIELFAPVDYGTDRKATVAIGVDKVDAARRALTDHLVEWRIPERVFAGAMSS